MEWNSKIISKKIIFFNNIIYDNWVSLIPWDNQSKNWSEELDMLKILAFFILFEQNFEKFLIGVRLNQLRYLSIS